MASTSDSGLGHGTNGAPQTTLEEQNYPNQIGANEKESDVDIPPKYEPTAKHDPKHGYGSKNPIKSQEEGQKLIDTGYKNGKQIYNVTNEGKIVKFQPANNPSNGYHAYEVSKPRDIPASVLKKLRDDGKISKSTYNKLRKGKK